MFTGTHTVRAELRNFRQPVQLLTSMSNTSMKRNQREPKEEKKEKNDSGDGAQAKRTEQKMFQISGLISDKQLFLLDCHAGCSLSLSFYHGGGSSSL